MLRSRLFWKFFVPYVALTLIFAAGITQFFGSRQRALIVDEIRERLRVTATLLRAKYAGEFPTSSNEALTSELKKLAAETDARLTLIAADGTVIADSHENVAQMANHADRNEVRDALDEEWAEATRPSPTLNIPMLYVATRVGERGMPNGVVRAAVSLAAVESSVTAFRRNVWIAATAVCMVMLGLTYLLLTRVLGPLKALTEATRNISSGQMGRTVAVTNRDELGTLARAFNAMSRDLKTQIDQLNNQGRELEARGQRLSTVLSGMLDGVVAVDAQERILFMNDAARAFLDISAAHEVGRPFWEIIRNETLHAYVRAGLAGEEQSPIELQVPRTRNLLSVMGSRLPGTPCPGVVVVVHDVSELRRLENIRREFVSNVSHELKTPLAAIQAYAETLLAGAIDDPGHNRDFLQRIEENAERLHALILDLLRLARIESGADAFELVDVDVTAAIKTCRERHLPLAEAKGVNLTAESSHDPTRVHADAEGMQTILGNLVDNAIKYTPAGGRVDIRCRRENGEVTVDVIDSGVGIPESHLNRIFERFYRVDRARSRDVGGTGLGLSIVKHLVQEFGGVISVRSKPGSGSTFTVRLPSV